MEALHEWQVGCIAVAVLDTHYPAIGVRHQADDDWAICDGKEARELSAVLVEAAKMLAPAPGVKAPDASE